MDTKSFMVKAIQAARSTMQSGMGGPFGAVVVDESGELFEASNTVLASKDPTAHAEINAIRKACASKKTHDLHSCILFTTCYPCPMCLSACIWANIKKVYYGCTAEDAEEIGFRDDYIYRFIQQGCLDHSVLELHDSNRHLCLELFEEYASSKGTIY
ncbi:MAG: nucleoside deaminase [Spirochaetia bacterium]|nr:nucleoside deaminase [Spirochaetia bacterium]